MVLYVSGRISVVYILDLGTRGGNPVLEILTLLGACAEPDPLVEICRYFGTSAKSSRNNTICCTPKPHAVSICCFCTRPEGEPFNRAWLIWPSQYCKLQGLFLLGPIREGEIVIAGIKSCCYKLGEAEDETVAELITLTTRPTSQKGIIFRLLI